MIELNEHYILIGMDRETFYDIVDGNYDELFITENGMYTRDIIYKASKTKLDVYNIDHQQHCIDVLGKGEFFELLTIRDVPFENIPSQWIIYKNYNGERNIRGLKRECDKINILDHSWRNTAVVSFNSALAKIGNPDYYIVLLNEKYKKLNNGTLEQ